MKQQGQSHVSGRRLVRNSVRALAAAFSAAAISLIVISPASAHVSITPIGSVVEGGFAKFAFSVPNESKNDSPTVKLEVQFPSDVTLAFVSAGTKPGWKVEVVKRTLDTPVSVEGYSVTSVVDHITWTADSPATGIGSSQFDLFNVSAGPLPTGVESIAFKAVQTDADGTVKRWVDPVIAGEEEPDLPTPILQVTAAATDPVVTSTTIASSEELASGLSAQDAKKLDAIDGKAPNALAIAGLVAGLLGIVLGGIALAKSTKRS